MHLTAAVETLTHSQRIFNCTTKARRTSFFVSCMATLTAGKNVVSSVAAASSALLMNVLIASVQSAAAFVRHLPFSMTPSSILKTSRVDSGGKRLRIDFVTAGAAWRSYGAYQELGLGSKRIKEWRKWRGTHCWRV